MKKIIFVAAFLLAAALYGQNNPSKWDVFYYGDNNTWTDSLSFAVNDTASGAFYVPNSGIIISVDSNWTASGVGFMVYDELDAQWEVLVDEDGTAVEYTVTTATSVRLKPIDTAGLKYVKLYKVTSGSGVAQLTAASYVQIQTVTFN